MSAPTPLTYKGRPVPYIAAWSAEIVRLPDVLIGPTGIRLEGYPPDLLSGVTWKPNRDARGQGEAKFDVVHVPRQRYAMGSMLCQVCAHPVERNEYGWPWLLEDHRGESGWPQEEVTTHPPVCPKCQPVSALQCRHLRGNVVSVRAGRFVTDGVYGQLFQPGRPARKTVLFAGDARLRWMLGGQAAATLYDVTIVDMTTQAPVPREAVRR
ncbi:hypothetical protein [Streptomyces sp. NPDC056683]|uniref:hypothetical protein n=1 Tax=Streptomyces sp. NPDC056683 TaxID=3345910 RepID=UPI003691BF37